MLTLKDADDFFAAHLLKDEFSAFPDEKRLAAVQTASRDIAAMLNMEALPEPVSGVIRCAVFEQAAYLLLNPNILAGNTTDENVNHISPRARAWFTPEPELPAVCPLLRG